MRRAHLAVPLDVQHRRLAGQEAGQRFAFGLRLNNHFFTGQQRHMKSAGEAENFRQRIEQYQIDNVLFTGSIPRSFDQGERIRDRANPGVDGNMNAVIAALGTLRNEAGRATDAGRRNAERQPRARC